jgi:hypothetical protein
MEEVIGIESRGFKTRKTHYQNAFLDRKNCMGSVRRWGLRESPRKVG